jgi:hypothetical protein
MEEELLFVAKIDKHRSVCLSALPRETLDETGVTTLGGDKGYFIYEVNDNPLANGVSVLAKVASLDAAFRLVELWRDKPKAVARQKEPACA